MNCIRMESKSSLKWSVVMLTCLCVDVTEGEGERGGVSTQEHQLSEERAPNSYYGTQHQHYSLSSYVFL